MKLDELIEQEKAKKKPKKIQGYFTPRGWKHRKIRMKLAKESRRRNRR